MVNNSRLNEAKKLAEDFLYLPLSECQDVSPTIIVQHPFFTSCLIWDAKNKKFINATKETEEYENYLEVFTKEFINHCDSIEDIVKLMNKTYIGTFLKFLEEGKIINAKECGNIYGKYWQSIEFHSLDNNVTVRRIVKWLSKADKECIMCDKDLDVFNNLNDEIMVYRGVEDKKYRNGLSWTDNLSTAEFFAKRMSGSGFVYTGIVNKKDVIATFSAENEIVVDYKKVQSIMLLR